MRHRLVLSIVADPATPLALKMPERVAIDRLRRDGLAVVPTLSGEELLVEPTPPVPGRPFCTLTIDYRTMDDPRSGPIEPARLLPVCSLPCLGFAWELLMPEAWVVEKTERGLEATDPRATPSLASRLLGFDWSPWRERDAGVLSLADELILGELDRSAAAISDGETILGDWLLRLDAGPRPLVVDRLAIRSSGWGPGTRIASSPVGSNRLGERPIGPRTDGVGGRPARGDDPDHVKG